MQRAISGILMNCMTLSRMSFKLDFIFILFILIIIKGSIVLILYETELKLNSIDKLPIYCRHVMLLLRCQITAIVSVGFFLSEEEFYSGSFSPWTVVFFFKQTSACPLSWIHYPRSLQVNDYFSLFFILIIFSIYHFLFHSTLTPISSLPINITPLPWVALLPL